MRSGNILIKSFAILGTASMLAACSPAASSDTQVDNSVEDSLEISDDNSLDAAIDVANGEMAPDQEPVQAANGPSFDTLSYCRKIGDVAGGSYQIEKACRDQESDARSDIASMNISSRINRYCTEIGEVAGGSYQIYKACVEQEAGAAGGL